MADFNLTKRETDTHIIIRKGYIDAAKDLFIAASLLTNYWETFEKKLSFWL